MTPESVEGRTPELPQRHTLPRNAPSGSSFPGLGAGADFNFVKLVAMSTLAHSTLDVGHFTHRCCIF